LVELAEELSQRGIGLKSLNDPIDTSTAQGKLVFNIFAALAEFERGIISERTNAGLSAARARGRMGGRRPGLSEDAQKKARVAESFYKEGLPVNQIAEDLNISKATLYRYLRFRKIEIGKYKKQST
jgi:DNA invertase Pin-like site-specific DNA recombinase